MIAMGGPRSMAVAASVIEGRRERPPELSVVVPLYDEQDGVRTLHTRLTAALEPLEIAYELVFVDDGSQDGTTDLLDGIAAADSRVVVLQLSRNFGHQAAVSAGIDHARGQAVVVMDGDLQDPPEVIPRLPRRLARWLRRRLRRPPASQGRACSSGWATPRSTGF